MVCANATDLDANQLLAIGSAGEVTVPGGSLVTGAAGLAADAVNTLAADTGNFSVRNIRGSHTFAIRDVLAGSDRLTISSAGDSTFSGAVSATTVTASTQLAATAVGSGTTSGLYLNTTNDASIGFRVSGQAADNRLWDFRVNGLNLIGRTLNDTQAVGVNWLNVTRSGNTIASTSLYAGSGAATVSTTGLAVTGALTSTANANGGWAMTATNSHATGWGVQVKGGADAGDRSFEVQSQAGASLMLVDGAGAVTMPATPAFSAAPSAAQDNLAVAPAVVDIVLGTEIFDQGANFASNTFTAPVAGRYQLNAILGLVYIDSAADFYQVQIATSNRTYTYTYDPDFGQDAVYWEFGPSVLADMDASDTAVMRFYQSGGTAQTDVATTRTFFNGYLAC
jgi:hypothetical protein